MGAMGGTRLNHVLNAEDGAHRSAGGNGAGHSSNPISSPVWVMRLPLMGPILFSESSVIEQGRTVR